MPQLHARSRRADETRSGTDTRKVNTDVATASSILEQKIHPNINLLAEKLESSCHYRRGKSEVEVFQDLESSTLEIADFAGLKPSTRSHRLHKKAHKRDNNLVSNDYEHPSKAIPSRVTDDSPSYVINSLPNQQVLEPLQYPASSMKWQAFGKRPVVSTANSSVEDLQMQDGYKFASPSSLENSQSFNTCHSQPSVYRRTSQTLRTPESKTSSRHFSTPSYGKDSSERIVTLPSPHIFGMNVQPTGSGQDRDATCRAAKETPPLPPLDHPAFRKGPPSSFKFPTSEYNFPDLQRLEDFGAEVHDFPAGRQMTHSLPSLRDSRSKKGGRAFKESQNRVSSSRSGANTGIHDVTPEKRTKRHLRQQSKSSITTFTSSRRSSAEYSARQVSSLAEGIHEMQDECWEVEVSRAMVNLALGKEQRVETRSGNSRRQSQDGYTSSFGTRKARGKNRASGGEQGLGSPFLLQDTRRDNQVDSPSSKDHSARIRTNAESHNLTIAAEKDNLRNSVMTNGDSILHPTGSSATHIAGKGKGKEVAVDASFLPGSRSKRTGRAISSPLPTQSNPPEPARLDLASAHSSALRPPQISVVSATPESSPSSATAKRGHHKSTPSMPTVSVLKTPSTPSAIEKSHSTGSGKRKADEAGVSGDTTPPKESREARTTFAPEPRPHRASATSGVSTHAPSSFNRSKRVRLSETHEGRGSSYRSTSRAGSLPTPNDSPPNAKNTGSWSSKGSHAAISQSSHNYGHPGTTSVGHGSYSQQHRAPSRRSLSQASIPISALISPHAPSIGRLSTFHMRDPRKPSPIQSTPWSLSFPSTVQSDESRWSSRGWLERGGSPLHAWLFFIGFIIFPLWWVAALIISIPRTRTLGENADTEKGVILDDPQLEHDARSWRTRCRVMAGVSLLTYVPFIILVAIFA